MTKETRERRKQCRRNGHPDNQSPRTNSVQYMYIYLYKDPAYNHHALCSTFYCVGDVAGVPEISGISAVADVLAISGVSAVVSVFIIPLLLLTSQLFLASLLLLTFLLFLASLPPLLMYSLLYCVCRPYWKVLRASCCCWQWQCRCPYFLKKQPWIIV